MLSCREKSAFDVILAQFKTDLIGCRRFFSSPRCSFIQPSGTCQIFMVGLWEQWPHSLQLITGMAHFFITWKGLCLLIWGLKLTIPPASPIAYLTLSCGAKNEEAENHVQLVARGFVWGNLCSRRNLYLLFKHTHSWLNFILVLNTAWLNGTITLR